jgi:hypothetical protein
LSDEEKELTIILCRLKPGWALTVPDEALDKMIPGSRAQQATRIREIAQDYGCSLKHAPGTQTFERWVFPKTG